MIKRQYATYFVSTVVFLYYHPEAMNRAPDAGQQFRVSCWSVMKSSF